MEIQDIDQAILITQCDTHTYSLIWYNLERHALLSPNSNIWN